MDCSTNDRRCSRIEQDSVAVLKENLCKMEGEEASIDDGIGGGMQVELSVGQNV